MARLGREESQARTRERLIEAAWQAIARHGYAGASVGNIAEAAGYSKGAFYSNFASKEAILLELLTRHKRQEIDRMRALIDASADSAAFLRTLRQHYMAPASHLDWALLAVELQLHAARTPSFARAYGAVHREQVQALGEVIAALFLKAGKRVRRADAIAAGLMALTLGLAIQPTAGHSGASGSAGEVMAAMLEGLIAAAEPGR